MENRFRNYLGLIIGVAVAAAVFCMAATDIFWGLLISVAVVPITCLFSCGVITIIEAFKQREPNRILQNFSEPSDADVLVEEIEAI